MSSDAYSRKISSKEAEKGFIFILKNKLSFFPSLGDKFELVSDNSSKEVCVESYSCTCRGPERPHEHYFIQFEELKARDKIEITKPNSSDSNYFLKIYKL
ncbi:MAG TPA: hypothetical protein VK426_08075 [Methanobacterium sp.]|nr:hypothetical protein [Methanobacterium sp.]